MRQGWDPIRDLLTLQERMNELFEDTVTGGRARSSAGPRPSAAGDWTPAADLSDREAETVVEIDLPGIDRESLDVRMDGDQLVVSGTRTRAGTGRITERPSGTFERRFSISGKIDQSGISADYRDGVLTIRLPRAPETEARRVKIKVT